MNRRGAGAAFADEEAKTRLLSQIDAWAEGSDVRDDTLGSPVP